RRKPTGQRGLGPAIERLDRTPRPAAQRPGPRHAVFRRSSGDPAAVRALHGRARRAPPRAVPAGEPVLDLPAGRAWRVPRAGRRAAGGDLLARPAPEQLRTPSAWPAAPGTS